MELLVTNWFGFLCVLVCSQVDRPRVHHGTREQVSQLSTEGCRNHLIGGRERRGHEEGCGFRCWGDDVRRMNEKAWRGGRV